MQPLVPRVLLQVPGRLQGCPTPSSHGSLSLAMSFFLGGRGDLKHDFSVLPWLS